MTIVRITTQNHSTIVFCGALTRALVPETDRYVEMATPRPPGCHHTNEKFAFEETPATQRKEKRATFEDPRLPSLPVCPVEDAIEW